MAKVVGDVQRHLAQRPDGDVTSNPWRYPLMNWGHDPKKRPRAPASHDPGPWPDLVQARSGLAGMLDDPDLGTGPVDRSGPIGHIDLGRALQGQCPFQFPLGSLDVDHG
jgi:hypothetical protein